MEGESLPPISGVVESICAAADENRNRRFLTADEASEFLGGLNTRTVTRWAREGTSPPTLSERASVGCGASCSPTLRTGCSRAEPEAMTIDIQACADTLSLATDAPTRGMHIR
jgi:hypothetical protein